MTGRELLRQCRKELKEIIILEGHLEYLETSLLPRAIQYKHDRILTTPEDYYTQTMAKAADLNSLINEKLGEMKTRQSDALRLIFTLPDSRQRQVLMTYYLTTMTHHRGDYIVQQLHTWETVAEVLGYSEQHVRRLHCKAIEILER